jgi:hypothetical protein
MQLIDVPVRGIRTDESDVLHVDNNKAPKNTWISVFVFVCVCVRVFFIFGRQVQRPGIRSPATTSGGWCHNVLYILDNLKFSLSWLLERFSTKPIHHGTTRRLTDVEQLVK